ncbi:hypothetical protein KKH03_00635 [Patescibacteria group bacterium]|nr:hypothetical protein [Patescibacteria group bacterium]
MNSAPEIARYEGLPEMGGEMTTLAPTLAPTPISEPDIADGVKNKALGVLEWRRRVETAQDVISGISSRFGRFFNDNLKILMEDEGEPKDGSPEALSNVNFTGAKAIYENICRIPDKGEGMGASHSLFMESVYPKRYLDFMQSAFDRKEDGYHMGKVILDEAAALFKKAMDMVAGYAENNGVSLYEAFMELYDEAIGGSNDFLVLMRNAREKAFWCARFEKNNGHDQAEKEKLGLLLAEHDETEYGLEFPAEFTERLNDPETRAFVLSLDFNSTFNIGESYPSVDLVAGAQRRLQSLARSFSRAYPEKEIVMAINTGRPGMYAWGVAEAAFAPMPELRKVAIAESGGVILEEGLSNGAMRVAVEHPYEWKRELKSIKRYLLGMIQNPKSVVVEPKLSMLSIKVAEDGEFCLQSANGETITPEWVEDHIDLYFQLLEESLQKEFTELMDDIAKDLPHMKTYLDKAVEELGPASGNGKRINGGKRKAIAELKNVVASVTKDHERRIADIKARFAIVDMMYDKGLLQTKFNPTAGYVDIGHAHINKFSTLMRHVCAKNGLTPDQVLFVQIGDSTTDIIPNVLTDVGEPNEGADNAYLVAVQNCNGKLREAVLQRGEKGLTTLRPSILGACAAFKGLKTVIDKNRLSSPVERYRA